MTFWEHLDELRVVLIRAAVVMFVLMVVIFCFKSFVFDKVLLAPLSSDFVLYRAFDSLLAAMHLSPTTPFAIQLINVEMTAQFFLHVRASFALALVFGMPYLFYELWTFVRPALYADERKAVRKSFGFAALQFYVGVAVGYLLVFPLTIRFLGTYQVSAYVPNQITISSYLGMLIAMSLVMGIVFEMPVLSALLSHFGIIDKQWLMKYRRHAVVLLVLFAAVITPSGDPVTLAFVSVPLYLLYELSILVTK